MSRFNLEPTASVMGASMSWRRVFPGLRIRSAGATVRHVPVRRDHDRLGRGLRGDGTVVERGAPHSVGPARGPVYCRAGARRPGLRGCERPRWRRVPHGEARPARRTDREQGRAWPAGGLATGRDAGRPRKPDRGPHRLGGPDLRRKAVRGPAVGRAGSSGQRAGPAVHSRLVPPSGARVRSRPHFDQVRAGPFSSTTPRWVGPSGVRSGRVTGGFYGRPLPALSAQVGACFGWGGGAPGYPPRGTCTGCRRSQ